MPVLFSGRATKAPKLVMDLIFPSKTAPTVNSIYALLPPYITTLSLLHNDISFLIGMDYHGIRIHQPQFLLGDILHALDGAQTFDLFR